MTQEFLLSVTPVEGDKYLIRTEHERMSAGVPVAQEIVTWQVEDWIEQAAKLMDDPLLGLLRSGTPTSATPPNSSSNSNLVLLGQQLYHALFQGTIRDSWLAAQGIAQNQHDILRLRLGLMDNRLPRLPWEVMNGGDRPLATGTDVVFSRYQVGGIPAYVGGGSCGPLRILMVLSAPTDQDQLKLHEEANHLREELERDRSSHQGPEIELKILEQPGREQLTQDLEQGNYDIFHYAGHSHWGTAGGDLYLVNSRTGLTEALSGEDLAGLLVNNGVRMAVLNSCRGGHGATATGDSIENLADALLRRGVPAILAMAERIPDDVALSLSRLFYRNLKQGYPIDLSLNRSRQGLISSYGSHQLYWALPILYLRPEFDGYLHNVGTYAIDPIDMMNSPMVMDFESLPMDDFEGVMDLSLDDDYASDRSTIADLMQGLDPSPTSMFPSSTPLRQSPVDDLLVLGKSLQNSGDLTGAIDAYGQALKLDGQNAVIYDCLGTALQQYGNLPEALSAYRMAVQLDPTLDSAQANLNAIRQGNPSRGSQIESPGQAAVFGNSKRRQKSDIAPFWKKPASIAIASIAAMGLGFGAIKLSEKSNGKNDPIVAVSNDSNTSNSNTSSSDISLLVATATEEFNKKNPRRAQESVEALLNQNALVAAETALTAASSDQLNIHGISYLRGRLSWEFAAQGNTLHSPQDARRYWVIAAQKQSNNSAYQNALGWSYYMEKNYDLSTSAWTQVLTLTESDKTSKDRAMATIGLALNYMQMAKKDSKKSQSLKVEAVKLRDRAFKARPDDFTEKSIANNWLWTEKMIGDFKELRSL
ncbi:MAG: CHAT domain-containing protein [Alkalinema sp. CAN_BIN05]|nr:CHAT domain-containing protein [Alkalinema sp. CAN_BIN05]